MKILKSLAFALCVSIATFATSANASLIGNNITASGAFFSPKYATVGDGIEFATFNNLLKFDFADDSLTIRADGSLMSWSGFPNLVFTGFAEEIKNFSILSNNRFVGSIVSGFSFTAQSIILNMSNSSIIYPYITIDPTLPAGPGQGLQPAVLVFKVDTVNNVPEPSAAMLIFVGLLGLARSRRMLNESKPS